VNPNKKICPASRLAPHRFKSALPTLLADNPDTGFASVTGKRLAQTSLFANLFHDFRILASMLLGGKRALATLTRPRAIRRRSARVDQVHDQTARPRLSRNPIPESTAFNIAARRPENNFFGCPHHKQVTLATLCGLPHAEQSFTCRIEGFFPGGAKLNAPSAQMLP
jgi:hypothetical protein